jgi:hypothetical protein
MVTLDNSRVTDSLDMGELHVDNWLVMSQAEFADVWLRLANVQGHLILAKSKVSGDLGMLRLRVGGDLVGVNVQFNSASLAMAVVDGTLSLIGATVNGDLNMLQLRVGRDLLLSSISEKSLVDSMPEAVRSSVDTMGLKVGGDPTALLKAQFTKVDLTGASLVCKAGWLYSVRRCAVSYP